MTVLLALAIILLLAVNLAALLVILLLAGFPGNEIDCDCDD